MDLENESTLKQMAKSHDDSMRFVAKDNMHLARMLGKTPYRDKDGCTDRFMSNLVQASFSLTAFTLAAKSFNTMIADKQVDPNCTKPMIEYFADQVDALKLIEAERDAALNTEELKDDDQD